MMIRQRRSKGSFRVFFFLENLPTKWCKGFALDVELMIKKCFSFLSYFFSLEERYKL